MNLQAMLKTRKGQLIALLILFCFVQIVLLISWGGSFLTDLPNEAKMKQKTKEVEKLRKDYQKVAAEKKERDDVKKAYLALASRSWLDKHDGVIETTLRYKINEVSQKRDFKLNNIGSVRVSKINDEFSYAEIDIAGNGEIGDVAGFIAAIRKIEPVLSWRRIDLRPDNRFRPSTGVGSSNLAAKANDIPPTRLNFNGSLRVLRYEGPLTAAELKITRPAFVQTAEPTAQNAVTPAGNVENAAAAAADKSSGGAEKKAVGSSAVTAAKENAQ